MKESIKVKILNNSKNPICVIIFTFMCGMKQRQNVAATSYSEWRKRMGIFATCVYVLHFIS